jgi:hypothetical protein
VIIGDGVTCVEMAGAVAELSWRPASANPALIEAIVVRVSDRHRQLPSYLHSAAIFSRLLTRSNETELEFRFGRAYRAVK